MATCHGNSWSSASVPPTMRSSARCSRALHLPKLNMLALSSCRCFFVVPADNWSTLTSGKLKMSGWLVAANPIPGSYHELFKIMLCQIALNWFVISKPNVTINNRICWSWIVSYFYLVSCPGAISECNVFRSFEFGLYKNNCSIFSSFGAILPLLTNWKLWSCIARVVRYPGAIYDLNEWQVSKCTHSVTNMAQSQGDNGVQSNYGNHVMM